MVLGASVGLVCALAGEAAAAGAGLGGSCVASAFAWVVEAALATMGLFVAARAAMTLNGRVFVEASAALPRRALWSATAVSSAWLMGWASWQCLGGSLADAMGGHFSPSLVGQAVAVTPLLACAAAVAAAARYRDAAGATLPCALLLLALGAWRAPTSLWQPCGAWGGSSQAWEALARGWPGSGVLVAAVAVLGGASSLGLVALTPAKVWA